MGDAGPNRMFIRTKMCKFHENGACLRGERCNYAHDDQAKRPLPNLQKTKLCPMLRRQGCTDAECPYAHRRSELRTEIISVDRREPTSRPALAFPIQRRSPPPPLTEAIHSISADAELRPPIAGASISPGALNETPMKRQISPASDLCPTTLAGSGDEEPSEQSSTLSEFRNNTVATEVARNKPVNNFLRKTKMCRFHVFGACKAGDQCNFAHGNEELQRAPDLYRTKMCPNLVKLHKCKEPQCGYAHRKSELRKKNAGHMRSSPFHSESGGVSTSPASQEATIKKQAGDDGIRTRDVGMPIEWSPFCSQTSDAPYSPGSQGDCSYLGLGSPLKNGTVIGRYECADDDDHIVVLRNTFINVTPCNPTGRRTLSAPPPRTKSQEA